MEAIELVSTRPISVAKAFCDLIKSNNGHRHLNWLMILMLFFGEFFAHWLCIVAMIYS